jgi:hypothetical protein
MLSLLCMFSVTFVACPFACTRAIAGTTNQDQPVARSISSGDVGDATSAQRVAPDLTSILELWRQGDSTRLRALAEDDSHSAIEGMFAAYFLFRLGVGEAKQLFLARYPRNRRELAWLFIDQERVLSSLCRPEEGSVCESGATERLLIDLAADGDSAAMMTFVESWLTNTDGGIAEATCLSDVARLIDAQPGLLLNAAVRGGSHAEDVMVICAKNFSGTDSGVRRAEQLKRLELAADLSAFRARLVEQLEHQDPEWP